MSLPLPRARITPDGKIAARREPHFPGQGKTDRSNRRDKQRHTYERRGPAGARGVGLKGQPGLIKRNGRGRWNFGSPGDEFGVEALDFDDNANQVVSHVDTSMAIQAHPFTGTDIEGAPTMIHDQHVVVHNHIQGRCMVGVDPVDVATRELSHTSLVEPQVKLIQLESKSTPELDEEPEPQSGPADSDEAYEEYQYGYGYGDDEEEEEEDTEDVSPRHVAPLESYADEYDEIPDFRDADEDEEEDDDSSDHTYGLSAQQAGQLSGSGSGAGLVPDPSPHVHARTRTRKRKQAAFTGCAQHESAIPTHESSSHPVTAGPAATPTPTLTATATPTLTPTLTPVTPDSTAIVPVVQSPTAAKQTQTRDADTDTNSRAQKIRTRTRTRTKAGSTSESGQVTGTCTCAR